jgi:hypothetical protein
MKAWIRTKIRMRRRRYGYGEAFVVGYVAYFTIAYAGIGIAICSRLGPYLYRTRIQPRYIVAGK